MADRVEWRIMGSRVEAVGALSSEILTSSNVDACAGIEEKRAFSDIVRDQMEGPAEMALLLSPLRANVARGTIRGRIIPRALATTRAGRMDVIIARALMVEEVEAKTSICLRLPR